MCKETLNDLFNLYFKNIENEHMLKVIAYKVAEEAINSGKMADIVALCECEVFSETFRKHLIKGFTNNAGLDNSICISLISKENLDFDEISLDELKKVSDKFTSYKVRFNSNLFRNVDHLLKDYILEQSIKNNDFEYVKNFIRNNEEYTYLRSKFLGRISNKISKEEYNELNYLIQDDLLCETKGVPKRVIEKRSQGALKHLI